MAKRVRTNPSGIVPTESDEIYRRITAWHQVDEVPPEELLAWLRGVSETVSRGIAFMEACREEIAEADEQTRLKAASTVLSGLDFLDRADTAARLLGGIAPGRVSEAFLEGVRIGLLHEKLVSIVDGRYSEFWRQQDRRQRGAAATNEAHAELRSQYQAAIVEVMETKSLTYTAALSIVAGRFGVSESTVKKHTLNPAPRNRGKWRDEQGR